MAAAGEMAFGKAAGGEADRMAAAGKMALGRRREPRELE